MPISMDEIIEATREMPPEVVAELVDRIMVAKYGGVDPAIASAWGEETARRLREIESSGVQGVPLEESLARARKLAGL
ncbi:MAG: addiction module protein [Verrucomicrobiae bacterium]|nr:addiction module protein [Verrucomicrobiae bacterium]